MQQPEHFDLGFGLHRSVEFRNQVERRFDVIESADQQDRIGFDQRRDAERTLSRLIDLGVDLRYQCRHGFTVGVSQGDHLDFRTRDFAFAFDFVNDLLYAFDVTSVTAKDNDSQFGHELDLHVAEQAHLTFFATLSSGRSFTAGRLRSRCGWRFCRRCSGCLLENHRHKVDAAPRSARLRDGNCRHRLAWFRPQRRISNHADSLLHLSGIGSAHRHQLRHGAGRMGRPIQGGNHTPPRPAGFTARQDLDLAHIAVDLHHRGARRIGGQ